MWLFLPFGFYSIVFKLPNEEVALNLFDKNMEEKRHSILSASDPYAHNFLCIRSRDKKSLLNLIDNIKKYRNYLKDIDVIYSDIIDDQGTDYQYRMWIERHVLAFYMDNYITDCDISNFKNACEYPYKNVFSKVWNTMWDLVEQKVNTFKENFRWQEYENAKFSSLKDEDYYDLIDFDYEDDSDER